MKRTLIKFTSLIILAAIAAASLSGCFVADLIKQVHPYKLRLFEYVSKDDYTGFNGLFEDFYVDYSVTDVTVTPAASDNAIKRIFSKDGVTAIEYTDGSAIYSLIRDGYAYQIYSPDSSSEMTAAKQWTDVGKASFLNDFSVVCPLFSGNDEDEDEDEEDLVISLDMIEVDEEAGEAYVSDEELLIKAAKRMFGELPDSYKADTKFFDKMIKSITYNDEEGCVRLNFVQDVGNPVFLIDMKVYGSPEERVEVQLKRPVKTEDGKYMNVEVNCTVENISYIDDKAVSADLDLTMTGKVSSVNFEQKYTAHIDRSDEQAPQFDIENRLTYKMTQGFSTYTSGQTYKVSCTPDNGDLKLLFEINSGSGKAATEGKLVFGSADGTIPEQRIEKAIENCE